MVDLLVTPILAFRAAMKFLHPGLILCQSVDGAPVTCLLRIYFHRSAPCCQLKSDLSFIHNKVEAYVVSPLNFFVLIDDNDYR